ncbi:glycosyltransferase [Paenibacillus terreus]|uniref:Glycosyltransferase n=1 Tax=Paenibacillus terreus TaxID=1387834 RepID=A0ABV5BH02_9BACL
MGTPSISLCMIVKNEEPYLVQCLSSARNIVDEIIVVDTGSTDRSAAIAGDFGAKVIHWPWDDSFSNARNRGLEEAKCDWILWLDADEVLDRNEAPRLKEVLTQDSIERQQIEGIELLLHNYLDGGRVERAYVLRLVRNRPAYRFEGRVHEQILPVMLKHTPNGRMGRVDVTVYHDGHLTRNLIRQDKVKRNISLLRKALEEHPSYWPNHYYLGAELFRANELEEGLAHLNTVLAHPEGVPMYLMVNAHKYRTLALGMMKRYEEMVEKCSASIAEFPAFTELYHYKAQGLVALGRLEQAVHVLQEALSVGPAPEEYPGMPGYGSYLTCFALGQCLAACENELGADWYFTLASLMDSGTITAITKSPGNGGETYGPIASMFTHP